MDYSQLAELVFAATQSAGADAELYVTHEKATNITVQQGAVEKFSFAGSKGLGVRVIRDGRMGYAYTSDFSPQAVRDTVDAALSFFGIYFGLLIFENPFWTGKPVLGSAYINLVTLGYLLPGILAGILAMVYQKTRNETWRSFAGITAVIHPGGSMRDQEVIDAADERGVVMLFTGTRHFRH